jgi:LmbE family N-acetylglucosaminyl deacetylase
LIQARRVLAISPHLDDAALSAGALLAGLADRGSEVHVATLFAGPPREALSPVARAFHDKCGLPHDATAVAIRRREDLEAMSILGAITHHGELPDAVYRRRHDGSWLCDHDQAMFTAPSHDDDITPAVRTSVEFLLESVAPDLVITCAAVGDHTDHLLTRAAVTAAADPAKTEILLWEDLPYAVTAGPPADDDLPIAIPVSPAEWSRKHEALARYASQTRMLWPDQADWAQVLKAHALSRGGGLLAEVLWAAHRSGRHVPLRSPVPLPGRRPGEAR